MHQVDTKWMVKLVFWIYSLIYLNLKLNVQGFWSIQVMTNYFGDHLYALYNISKLVTQLAAPLCFFRIDANDSFQLGILTMR